MVIKLVCRDYGFECEFIAQGSDIRKVIEEYSKHSTDEHGIEYSKEALMQFIIRKSGSS
jgi:predicted small metal-binding protein